MCMPTYAADTTTEGDNERWTSKDQFNCVGIMPASAGIHVGFTGPLRRVGSMNGGGTKLGYGWSRKKLGEPTASAGSFVFATPVKPAARLFEPTPAREF